MESALKGPHTVLQKHDEELLLNHRRSIMEGEEIWEGISLVFRFGKNAVFVQGGHGSNGLSHQVIGLSNHVITLG